MPGRIAVGCKTIKYGTCGTNGTMGTTLSTVGLIVPDSVIFNLAEPDSEPVLCEDVSGAVSYLTDGTQIASFEWEQRDISPATLAKFISGTTTGEVFTPDVAVTIKEASVELTTLVHGGKSFKFEFPRTILKASIAGEAKKKGTFRMKIKCDVAVPFDGSGNPLAQYKISRV